MNRRESIIIVVAVAIGIYGLLDYFVLSGKKVNGKDENLAVAVGKIDTFAQTASLDLTQVVSKKDFQDTGYLISKAEAKWENDPFWIYQADDMEYIATAEEKLPELSYTGFIKAGQKVLAVVNGMEYTLGELLRDVGYKVSRITPLKVVLLTEANKEIILQLEEN